MIRRGCGDQRSQYHSITKVGVGKSAGDTSRVERDWVTRWW